MYILHSHIISHLPTSVVKYILTQPDPKGRRGKWIAVLLEYDLEIKPTKMIKGKGPTKFMAVTCPNFVKKYIIIFDFIPRQYVKFYAKL